MSTFIFTFIEFPLWQLNSERKQTNLKELSNNKPMIIDLWHSKCTRCPAALDKLDRLSKKYENVLFVSIALSQGDGNIDLVDELIEE